MERSLTLFERALFLDGRAPVALVLTARLSGRISEDRLRHALERLQAKHPLLRCLIPAEPGPPRFVEQMPAPPIPLRIVARQGDEDWQHLSRAEWDCLFDASRVPLVRLAWLRGAAVSELILSCHHCLCDGRSVTSLLGDLLLLCDQPERDIGRFDGLQPLARILPEEVLRDRRLQRRVRWKAGLLKWFIRSRRPGPAKVYGKPYLIHWDIGPEATKALREHCEQAGVGSVFAALAAAFMLAFRDVRGPRGLGSVAVPVDARSFLDKLKPDSLFAMAPTLKLSLKRAAKTADVWMLAKAIKTDMTRKIERMAPSVFENLLGLEHLHGVFDKLVAYGQSRPGGQGLALSNLGRLTLPQEYRNFRLEMIHAPSCIVAPTPANLIICAGFAGCLNFSFMSDELSLPFDQAFAVKEKAMAMLFAGMLMPAPSEALQKDEVSATRVAKA